jgi:integrase
MLEYPTHDRPAQMTLRQALELHINSKKRLADSQTAHIYRARTQLHLRDWLDMPLVEITESMVVRRHRELRKKGNATAKLVFRILRAVCNRIAMVDLDFENPVDVLSDDLIQRRAKGATDGRALTPVEIGKVWIAVQGLVPTTRDYLTFILLTGISSQDATLLTWDNVQLNNASVFVRSDANAISLSKYTLSNLAARRAHANGSLWVFATDYDSSRRPICNVGRSIKAIHEITGIEICTDDLVATYRQLARDIAITQNLEDQHTITQAVTDKILAFADQAARVAHR